MPGQIGYRIRTLRTLKGVSMADLAKKSSISLSKLSRIECGIQSDPKIGDITSIAKALGIPKEALIDGNAFTETVTAVVSEGRETA